MRAVVCRELGPAEKLVVEEREPLRAGPDHVVVDVHACGVNYVDTLFIQGLYQIRPEPPFVPGGEVAGVVSALGDGVEGVRVGVGGDYAAAAEAFQRSDGYLRYWASRDGTGIFKLYNQMNIVRALELAGQAEQARDALAQIAEVNPAIAGRYDQFYLWFQPPS